MDTRTCEYFQHCLPGDTRAVVQAGSLTLPLMHRAANPTGTSLIHAKMHYRLWHWVNAVILLVTVIAQSQSDEASTC